jgi:hypothetical protein
VSPTKPAGVRARNLERLRSTTKLDASAGACRAALGLVRATAPETEAPNT